MQFLALIKPIAKRVLALFDAFVWRYAFRILVVWVIIMVIYMGTTIALWSNYSVAASEVRVFMFFVYLAASAIYFPVILRWTYLDLKQKYGVAPKRWYLVPFGYQPRRTRQHNNT